MNFPRERGGPSQREPAMLPEGKQVLFPLDQRRQIKLASIWRANERPHRRVVDHSVDRGCITGEGQKRQGLASEC